VYKTVGTAQPSAVDLASGFPILTSILTLAVVLLTRHRGRMTSFLSIKSAPDSVELVQLEV
jgi:hypothetical protein